MAAKRILAIGVLVALAGFAAAQQDGADAGADAAEEEVAPQQPTTVIDDLSQAEIDAELARAEEILDDPDELKEFTDTTPLPADLPLALPSDF